MDSESCKASVVAPSSSIPDTPAKAKDVLWEKRPASGSFPQELLKNQVQYCQPVPRDDLHKPKAAASTNLPDMHCQRCLPL